MKRTLLAGTQDGSLLITRQTRPEPNGSAKDRRKQARHTVQDESAWRTVDRVITKRLGGAPEKAQEWLASFQPQDGADDAVGEANERLGAEYVRAAERTVAEIEQATADFVVPPTPVVRVAFIYDHEPEETP